MAYLAYLDGGERATNNFGYYASEGISQIFYNGGGTLGETVGNLYINTNVNGQCYFSTSQSYAYGGGTNAGLLNNLRWTPSGLSSSTIYFGARIYTGPLGNYTLFYLCNANGVPQLAIYLNTDGSIVVYSGATNKFKGFGNFLGSTAAGLVSPYSIIFLEIYLVVSATSGVVTIHLNGNQTTPVLNLTNVNTASDTSSLPITFLECTGTSNNCFVRDIYFTDGTGSAPFNTFLGDVSVQYLTPSANVAVQFTPNGNSSNYLNAAQTPPNSGTDYNNATTVGSTDTFTVNSLASDTLNTFAVKLFDYSYGSGGLAKTITSGSTTVTGTVNTLTTTVGIHSDTYTTNPSTSGTWTTTAVNALTIGYKVIS
jgi:hypothetical protein